MADVRGMKQWPGIVAGAVLISACAKILGVDADRPLGDGSQEDGGEHTVADGGQDAPTTGPRPDGSEGPTGTITGFAAKCADVAPGVPADGDAAANGDAAADGDAAVDGGASAGRTVDLYECNGSSAQQWTMAVDGTIRAFGMCLDVKLAGTADGTYVQLFECNGTGAQQWVATSDRNIVNPVSGKCLDVTAANSDNGTPLQIWTCEGTANQKWIVPGP
ncbi:MAG TPA: ricin-type beta-trefoil lectin domain protein [Polyangiaceae bacterium]|nr:ricin-type beta-trefoil lectin domain protein [Polyangiaceae bacterium]